MQLGWHTAAIVTLGLFCGAAASAATVWMTIRLIRRRFAEPEFRDQLRDALLASPAVQGRIEAAVREGIRSRAAQPIGGLVPPAVPARLLAGVRAWLATPAAEPAVRRAVSAGLEAVARSEVSARQLVPWDLVPVIAAAVDRAMPMVIAQLGTALRERENQIRLHVAMRGMVDRFLAEQEGWKRAIGNFLITDRALAYLVETIATTGIDALGSTLANAETRHRIVGALEQGLGGAMDQPIRDLLGGLAPERVAVLSEQTTARILRAATDPANQARLAAAVETGWARIGALPAAQLVGARTGPELDALAARGAGAAIAALGHRTANALTIGAVMRRAFAPGLAWTVMVGALIAALVAAAASLALNPS